MRSIGLVDLQINGYAGVDFNSTSVTADAVDHALHAMLQSGVTTCLPTLITAPEDVLAERFAVLDEAVRRSRLGPIMVPGYHMEGPFLNSAPGYAGCHPAESMVPPEPGLIRRVSEGLSRPILLLTLAPERDCAIGLTAWARIQGMVVAMGHTAVDAATVASAVDAGVTLSTHLGNALPQPQPKFLNPLMAQLAADELAASFIADGIHVPPPVLKVLLRAKGLERCILITDATSAAAAPPGLYDFAGMTIEHAPDGAVRQPGSGVLAGSALCLDVAVRNIVDWGFASAESAIALASTHPATLLGPALQWHGIALPDASVDWSDGLSPRKISVGSMKIFTR